MRSSVKLPNYKVRFEYRIHTGVKRTANSNLTRNDISQGTWINKLPKGSSCYGNI
jgi:hypothetical protein